MQSLNDPTVIQQIKERFNKLTAASQPQWGKMTVSQMLAHCGNTLEANLDEKHPKPSFFGGLLGRMVKKSVVNEKPFKQGLPTSPHFVVANERDFLTEKHRLLALLDRIQTVPPKNAVHPFFGKMSAEEWNTLNSKHLDHHLRQFGV
jgi:hypothetical protein